MTELSLDPNERPLSTAESSLSDQIARIAQQRQSFQDISEETLKQEILAGSPTPAEEPSTVDAQKEFDEKRLLLSGKVRSALNESALSLDFVSLLVSAVRPQAGSSSMSPMLQGQVPAGTLSGDTIPQANVMPSIVDQRGNPGPGWKLTALDEAAGALEAAAARLSKETAKEETFWTQVERTLQSGERIQKVKKTLRVNYGYRDSGSRYFGSGLGKISRGDDGSLEFKADELVSQRNVVVTIHKNDEVHSQAWLECTSTNEIQIARHYMFEDELFFFLLAEARDASTVRLNEGAIVCQMYDYTIEIRHEKTEGASKRGTQADLVLNALHLLLNARHSRNLALSQQVPTPMGRTVPSAPQTPLLAPVLAHIQQATAETRAKKLLEMMFPQSSITKQELPPAQSAVEMLLELAPSTLNVSNPELTLTIDLPTFKATSGARKCTFYDFSELELWLRGLTS